MPHWSDFFSHYLENVWTILKTLVNFLIKTMRKKSMEILIFVNTFEFFCQCLKNIENKYWNTMKELKCKQLLSKSLKLSNKFPHWLFLFVLMTSMSNTCLFLQNVFLRILNKSSHFHTSLGRKYIKIGSF